MDTVLLPTPTNPSIRRGVFLPSLVYTEWRTSYLGLTDPYSDSDTKLISTTSTVGGSVMSASVDRASRFIVMAT